MFSMMHPVIIVFLALASAAEDPLRAVLRSPKASLKLYFEFKTKNHMEFRGSENSQRYRLFLASARHVADFNEDASDTGHYGVNKFSVMSEEERKSYLGMNMTLGEEEGEDEEKPLLRTTVVGSGASEVLWTNSGSVTEVQDQGSCGACWAFASVAAVEARYKIGCGVLRRFSEQELLDCVYESHDGRDGCVGGIPSRTYIWSNMHGGRLAAAKDRPYENMDMSCRSSETPDAMKAMKITGYGKVGKDEASHITALQSGAVVSAIVTTGKMYQYESSIMKDTTCADTDMIDHAITLVGYTPQYILMKNSWGTNWGDQGFARLARNHDNCKLYTFTRYPTLKSTGEKDFLSDTPAPYWAPSEDTASCVDTDESYCVNTFEELGCCTDCSHILPISKSLLTMLKYHACPKTCGVCGGCEKEGAVRCSDGQCREIELC